MTEWTVVTVIIAVAGLIGTVAVPLTKNTKAMTRLGEQINHLLFRIEREEQELTDFKTKAAARHEKIFHQLEVHDGKINDHEYRIKDLENKKEEKQ
ncbi:MAG TPA: hypothetical protein IAD23_02410 [Candidatus Scubalenecus merdavium]|uniref:Uncharacterized protein n=1 Tax=Candidatus Scybalenecus merdavium TaxID=2840939 RepID=A0A9D1SNQ8_9FIRM|nr:hypothetical protein [Candidatus Scubalenecus merdavium]